MSWCIRISFRETSRKEKSLFKNVDSVSSYCLETSNDLSVILRYLRLLLIINPNNAKFGSMNSPGCLLSKSSEKMNSTVGWSIDKYQQMGANNKTEYVIFSAYSAFFVTCLV